MRAIRIGLYGIVMFALGGIVAGGQQAGRGAPAPALTGLPLRLPAPTDKTVDYTIASVNAGFKEMQQKKLETYRILEGGAFNFNMRRETAAEEGAGTHGKKADLYLIKSGEATLTTDGQLIDPETGRWSRRRRGRQRHPQRKIAHDQNRRRDFHSAWRAAPDHGGQRRGAIPAVPLGHAIACRAR